MTPLNWQDHDLAHPLALYEPHWIDVPDLFGDGYDDATRDQYFAVMAWAHQHTYMLPTEHVEVMREYFADGNPGNWDKAIDSLPGGGDMILDRDHPILETRRDITDEYYTTTRVWPLPNFLPGVLVRTQREADERIPVLLGVQAAARFVLCELREAVEVNLRSCRTGRDSWMPSFRLIDYLRVRGGDAPMHPDWVRSLRDQCAAAAVPFAFEGWGEWGPASIVSTGRVTHAICRHGCVAEFTQWDIRAACSACYAWEGLRRVGRANSGRLLDDVLHDAYPQLESEAGR